MCVSAVLENKMVKSILIVEVNHITHVKHIGRRSGPNCGKNLYFRGLHSETKIKSMESSTNMKFTYNVDWDMVKMVGEENVIYVITAIEKVKNHIFNNFDKYVFFFKNCL